MDFLLPLHQLHNEKPAPPHRVHSAEVFSGSTWSGGESMTRPVHCTTYWASLQLLGKHSLFVPSRQDLIILPHISQWLQSKHTPRYSPLKNAAGTVAARASSSSAYELSRNTSRSSYSSLMFCNKRRSVWQAENVCCTARMEVCTTGQPLHRLSAACNCPTSRKLST